MPTRVVATSRDQGLQRSADPAQAAALTVPRERWWRRVPASEAHVPHLKRGSVAALPVLANAAASCTACDLFRNGTRVVFGEGPAPASLMLVGEQPGDKEEVAGHPFVGPAGAMLDRALEAAGIDRSTVYLTNAVKHFNFVGRGKRRIHDRPRSRHVLACRGWLNAELARVSPRVVVALGATASLALMGPGFRLTAWRGVDLAGPRGVRVLATVHPSALLRAPDRRRRESLWEELVGALKRARQLSSGGRR
jgi:uracil-DNA glycosylase